MPRHFYSSISFATSLSAGVTAAQATITTAESASDNGWPTSFPFTLALDYGLATQELVDVTSKGALAGGIRTWNVTRGVDGSPAAVHNAGAIVRHPIVGRDLDESGAHVYAATGVHGVAGAVVGTTDSQTLSGKTFKDQLQIQQVADTVIRWLANGVAMFWGDGVNGAFDTRMDRVGSGELAMFGTGAAAVSRWWVGLAAQAFSSELALRAAAGQQRALSFYSGGSLRWLLRAQATAEPGGNAGADLELSARDDTGAALSSPVTIRRSDGRITLATPLVASAPSSLIPPLTTPAVAASGGPYAALGRFLGVTTGGTPQAAGFTYAAGDWAVGTEGYLYVCLAGGVGSAATWNAISPPDGVTLPTASGPAAPGVYGASSPSDHRHSAVSLRLFNNAIQSIPSAVDTPLVYNVKEVDDGEGWWSSAAPGNLVLPTGIYVVSGTLRQSASAVVASERALWLRAGGTRYASAGSFTSAANQTWDGAVTSVVKVIAATATINFMAWQNSGAALNTQVSLGGQRLTVVRVG